MTGRGHTHLDESLALMDVPCMSSNTFQKYQQLIGQVIYIMCVHSVRFCKLILADSPTVQTVYLVRVTNTSIFLITLTTNFGNTCTCCV